MKNINLQTLSTIALLISGTPFVTQAAIDLRESSYTHKAIDFSRVNRTYNSRSDRKGLIGYGWCFDFEIQIELLSEREWAIVECGAPLEKVRFKKAPHSQEWVSAVDPEDYLIEKDGEVFRPTRAQVFQRSTGRLKQFVNSKGHLTKVSYDSLGRANEILYKSGKKIRFEYKENLNLVSSARDESGKTARYHYQNHDLVRIDDDGKPLWRFTYDEFHNMTRVQKGSKVIALLLYDTTTDRVMTYDAGDGCQERYLYAETRSSSVERFVADIERICSDGKKTAKSRFEFLYVGKGTRERSLAEMTIETREERTRISFDERTGRTLSIQKSKAIRQL